MRLSSDFMLQNSVGHPQLHARLAWRRPAGVALRLTLARRATGMFALAAAVADSHLRSRHIHLGCTRKCQLCHTYREAPTWAIPLGQAQAGSSRPLRIVSRRKADAPLSKLPAL